MLFYILSRLDSIRRGLAFYSIMILSRLGSICPIPPKPQAGMLFYIVSRLCSISRGLAFYSISYHALAVSA